MDVVMVHVDGAKMGHPTAGFKLFVFQSCLIYLLYAYECFSCMHVCVPHYVPGALGSQSPRTKLWIPWDWSY